jgi:hypothetical protein
MEGSAFWHVGSWPPTSTRQWARSAALGLTWTDVALRSARSGHARMTLSRQGLPYFALI